jgi:hypothetical protein
MDGIPKGSLTGLILAKTDDQAVTGWGYLRSLHLSLSVLLLP